MTFADRAVLFRYRIRPLEPVTLVAALVVAVAVGVATIPGGPPAGSEVATVSDVTRALTMVVIGLALTVGFVGGRDVDVAEQLLSSVPRPYRRALVLRVVLWAVVLAAVVWLLGDRAGHALEAHDGALRSRALVQALFAGSVTLGFSRALGSVAGGGGALAVVAVVAGLPLVFEGFPVALLADAGSAEWARAALRLELLSAGLVTAVYWRARP